MTTNAIFYFTGNPFKMKGYLFIMESRNESNYFFILTA